MSSVVLKSIIWGLLLGIVITIILKILTTSSKGRNVVTGEPMELNGFSAIFVKISEMGFSQYIVSVVPTFTLITVISVLGLGAYMWFTKNA